MFNQEFSGVKHIPLQYLLPICGYKFQRLIPFLTKNQMLSIFSVLQVFSSFHGEFALSDSLRVFTARNTATEELIESEDTRYLKDDLMDHQLLFYCEDKV